MTKFKIAAFVLVVGTLSALLVVRNNNINQMRARCATLEAANQDFEEMRTENARLKAKTVGAAELEGLRRDEAELIRLRAEKAASAPAAQGGTKQAGH